MATYNLNEAREVWKARADKIKRVKPQSELQGATFMVLTAKMFAPRVTGETIQGIRKRSVSNGYIVESRVREKVSMLTGAKFRQNLWVNQTAPFRSPHMQWNKSKATVYGDGSHATTGLPRFWHFATLKTRINFNRLVIINTRKALKVEI